MLLTAGASDMRVALEALGTARFYGLYPGLAPDIGVAGLHRLTPWLPSLSKARLLLVIAGMEGALPSVIAGLTGKPVLAVPTSVGYGVSAGGYAALMGMLSACSAGISVFNIDNGYGAAIFACRVLGAK
jgi:NCAIR mutase (PurE)-related protein